MSLDTADAVANDLMRLPEKVVRQGRGIAAKAADRAAAAAQQKALSTWTARGRGMAGSAGTIRARMSRDKSSVTAYVLADGEGAFQSEHGSGLQAPQPVVRTAFEPVVGWFETELGRAASRL
jgi:hypothetical protein